MAETSKPLSDFFRAIERDPRIGTTHIGIYAALLHKRAVLLQANPISVYSWEIMNIAKVSSPATYYKCVRDLADYGYIIYEPSYNRYEASKIHFETRPEIRGKRPIIYTENTD
ncbi:hypothetical protein LAG90_18085 [Marinilongibacter aquaticus]|uniref:hypothetical protein n=1 Tax=Marinilongibacter aquaticus TaxID=2975157 RepID=UPI0021BDC22C|nr:hypothetical protein [Marinilongibacter aquaticus]UBM58712.1 hypothetical protein LAG90_18085 [Marinilongibacter aquaticus]